MCLQTVWSVMLQKSLFSTPHEVSLLDMKNDTVANVACFCFWTVKRNWWGLWSTVIEKQKLRSLNESSEFLSIHESSCSFCVHVCSHIFMCFYVRIPTPYLSLCGCNLSTYLTTSIWKFCLCWGFDWLAMGSGPYGLNAPRPYRQVVCAP
jgi:hypothetical protein